MSYSNEPQERRTPPPQPPRQEDRGRRAPLAGQKPAGARRPSSGPRRKRPRSQNRWFRAIVMVLATVVGCVFLALFLLNSAYDLFGLNQDDLIVEITVPQDAGVGDVAKILRENGVVETPLTFRLYLWFKDVKDEDIKAGDYAFNANMSYNELIAALSSGYTEREEIRLTFPEGMTMLEIARELERNKVCSADALINYLDNEADYNFEFFGAIDDDPLRYHKLEGYLFPDTYDFFIGENVDSVARKFVRNFNDKLSTDLLERMQDLNLTIDQTITLASIIQKEAGDPDDMRLVSSVFHNRLNDSGNFPNLQSDVTILYVESDIKPRLQMANQPMYDAYNTYVRTGLPVGAITNPGMDAIRAALYPETTSYYYFVTDVNMDFYYAETLEAHNRNIQAAKEVTGPDGETGEVHGIQTS